MLPGFLEIKQMQVMHLEFIAEGHNSSIEGDFISFLQVADDVTLGREEAGGDRKDEVRVKD